FGAYDNLGAELATLAAESTNPADFVVLTIDLEYFCGGLYSPKWDAAQVKRELDLVLAAVDAIGPRSSTLLSTFVPPFRASLPWAPGHPILGKDSIVFQLNDTLRKFVGDRPGRC